MSAFDPAPGSAPAVPPPDQANRFMLLYAAVASGISLFVLAVTSAYAISSVTWLLWPEFWADPALRSLPDDAPGYLLDQALRQRPESLVAQGRQGLAQSAIAVVVAGPIFFIHWRILRHAWKRRKT